MDKYIYIINDKFLELNHKLDPILFEIGNTYEDSCNGNYVLLSDEQVLFKEKYPEASIYEVYNLTIKDQENYDQNKIELYRQDVLKQIDIYDHSGNINCFFYKDCSFWLDKATRVGLMNSTKILQENGELYTTLWLGDFCETILCEVLISMLEKLEVYALRCYLVTAKHKNEVMHFSDLNDIVSFDFTEGYPEKLRFEF